MKEMMYTVPQTGTPVGANQSEPSEPKKCFVIAPIGQPGSATRKRSDQILRHVIRPVVEPLGYTATRADEIDHIGMITSHVLDRIMGDELVIADLTDHNPNVFYELAVRHSIRRPFIQLIAADQAIPFDINGLKTIIVDHTDLDSVATAKDQLGNTVALVEQGAAIQTPMSVALSLQELKGSSNPEEEGISQIVDLVRELRHDLRMSRPSHGAVIERDLLMRVIDESTLDGQMTVPLLLPLREEKTSTRFREWANRVINRVSERDNEPPF